MDLISNTLIFFNWSYSCEPDHDEGNGPADGEATDEYCDADMAWADMSWE